MTADGFTTDMRGAVATGDLSERLLTIPHRIAGIGQRDSFLAAAAAELEDTLGVQVTIHSYEHDPGPAQPAPSRHFLDIGERSLQLARLELRRSGDFTAEERRLLDYLSLSLSYLLTMQAQQAESRLLAELSGSLSGSESLVQVAERAAVAVVTHLDALGAAVLMNSTSGFSLVSSAGDWQDDQTDRYVSIADDTVDATGAALHPGGVLACPIGDRAPARYMLVVRFPEDQPFLRAFIPSVAQAARTLAPHLESRWLTEVHTQLLKLHESPPDTPTQVMFERMLALAIRLVPGTDSGSLLVRNSSDEPFTFQAAQGFNDPALMHQTISYDEAVAWYGPDIDGWNSGLPRELRSDQMNVAEYGRDTTPDLDPVNASYDRIKASLCLPVLHEGQVMGTLNLENQHDPRAFGRDAREIIKLFGSPFASLLNRQYTRDMLTQAAMTDELTGILNRRAFRDIFERELKASLRSDRKVSLLMIDLKNFKRFNDTYGHDVGDEVLVAAARVLQENLRETDYLSRWGGDEFAAVLVDAPRSHAMQTAERLRQVCSAVTVQGHPLIINVGCATAPDDSTDSQELLKLADLRMFEDKRGD